MLRKVGFILFFLVTSISFVLSQDLSIQSSIDKSEIKTGEQAIISLNIRTDNIKNTTYELSKKDSLAFRIINARAKDTITIDDNISEFKVDILITSFDSTLIEIPPFILNNGQDQVLSQPLSLKVNQPNVDISKPDNIMPNKDVWTIEYTWRDYLNMIFSSWITYLIIFLIILALTLYFVWKYRQKLLEKLKEKEIPIPVKKLTPLELAYKEFEELDNTSYLANGEYKIYYSDIFDIIRRYVERKKDWVMLEKTSNEIISIFDEDKNSQALIPELKNIIKEADLVKFAKYTPSIDSTANYRRLSYIWIEKADKLWSEMETEKIEEKGGEI